MGLYSVRGTIAQLGQCQFDNKFVVYAYIEIVDPDGSRRLVKNVGIGVDVQSVIDVGSAGEFFFDEIFSTGGSSQFWGVSVDGRNVIDGVNVRKALVWQNLVWGTVTFPIFGIGLLPICLGIVRLWPLVTGSGDRREFFSKRIVTQPRVKPKRRPLSGRIGQVLRGAPPGTARKS